MKPKKTDGVEVWKEFEGAATRLELNVIERAVYSHLFRHTRLEGKLRLHFSLPELARKVGISRGPVRDALHRLAGHGALRFIERSYSGHLIELRLPAEEAAGRGEPRADGFPANPGPAPGDPRARGRQVLLLPAPDSPPVPLPGPRRAARQDWPKFVPQPGFVLRGMQLAKKGSHSRGFLARAVPRGAVVA